MHVVQTPGPPQLSTQLLHVARVSQHATPGLPHCALFAHDRAQNALPFVSVRQSYPDEQHPDPEWHPCHGAASFGTHWYALAATTSEPTTGAHA